MKKILTILIVIMAACHSINDNNSKVISKMNISEDFDNFYSKFYIDKTFQHERILLPLKGIIKSWDNDEVKEDTWEGKEIIITPEQEFSNVYKNLKVELSKKDTVAIENFWIENSGFRIERIFILRDSKWFLYSYNISNL
jgi:hypothetical protein